MAVHCMPRAGLDRPVYLSFLAISGVQSHPLALIDMLPTHAHARPEKVTSDNTLLPEDFALCS